MPTITLVKHDGFSVKLKVDPDEPLLECINTFLINNGDIILYNGSRLKPSDTCKSLGIKRTAIMDVM